MPLDRFVKYVDPSQALAVDCRSLFDWAAPNAFAQQANVAVDNLRVFWTFDGVLMAQPLFSGFSGDQWTQRLNFTAFRPLNTSNYLAVLSDFANSTGSPQLDYNVLLRTLNEANRLLAPFDQLAQATFTNASYWRAPSRSQTLRSADSASSDASSLEQTVQTLWTTLNLFSTANAPQTLDVDRAFAALARQSFEGVLRCGLLAPASSGTNLFTLPSFAHAYAVSLDFTN